MTERRNIAVLFDADNTPATLAEAVLEEVATYGRIVVKRAYGNWSKPILSPWLGILNRLAIKAEQQTDYVSGKNATDIALIIDAMDLLYKNLYDAFVIVSSDSDFTPLAMRLHESGVFVIGVGESKTPVPFRNACDNFILLENLNRGNASISVTATSLDSSSRTPATKAETKQQHKMLTKAWISYQDEDGYCNVCSANSYLRRAKSDFDPRTFGAASLPQLLQRYPELYRVERFPGKGTVTIVGFKCLNPNPTIMQEMEVSLENKNQTDIENN